METVIVKMLSGEEVIAVRKDDKYSRARVFQLISDGQGGAQAQLVPYIMIAPDAEFSINHDLVVTEIPCPAEVERKYLAATSPIALS